MPGGIVYSYKGPAHCIDLSGAKSKSPPSDSQPTVPAAPRTVRNKTRMARFLHMAPNTVWTQAQRTRPSRAGLHFLGRLDAATVAFQLHFGDAVKRHAHLREPGCDCVLIGSFHHADGFAFGQVGKAAITLDGLVLLRRLCKLTELLRREFPRRNGVGTHEFCHDVSLSAFVVFSNRP